MAHPRLVVRHIPPSRWWRRAQWELVEPLIIAGRTVPAGYVTDGTSAPLAVAWLVSPTGRAMPAAVLHDWLLSQLASTESRAGADAAFRAAMLACGVRPWRARMMWAAVRVYGAVKVAWQRLRLSQYANP